MARAQAGSSGGGANYTMKNKIRNLGKSSNANAVKKAAAVKKMTKNVKTAAAVKKIVNDRAYSHLPKRSR
jgi:hypothetical protein